MQEQLQLYPTPPQPEPEQPQVDPEQEQPEEHSWEMKSTSVCFTGHRVLTNLEKEAIRKQLPVILLQLYQQGFRFFFTGGALGFDTLAAQAILNFRQEHPDAHLVLVKPCPDQTANWFEADRIEYDRLAQNTSLIFTVSREYTPQCLHARNRFMVNHCKVCVAYCQRRSGGSFYTLNYARKQGLRLFYLPKPVEKTP